MQKQFLDFTQKFFGNRIWKTQIARMNRDILAHIIGIQQLVWLRDVQSPLQLRGLIFTPVVLVQNLLISSLILYRHSLRRAQPERRGESSPQSNTRHQCLGRGSWPDSSSLVEQLDAGMRDTSFSWIATSFSITQREFSWT